MNMTEIQKSNGGYLLYRIERLLKETKKTKRDLAKSLEVKENSINRTLKNSNISLSKVEIIADFFGVDIIELLPKKENNTIQEIQGEYKQTNRSDVSIQLAINNLSEALKRNSITIDSLVQIISENFPDKKNSIENIR